MYRSILFLFFSLIFHISYSQDFFNSGIRIRYACDTCSYNHNPVAFSGGNIESASIVETSEGKCLKLISSATIDTNIVPVYFDIYTTTWVSTADTCNSFRKLNEIVDCSFGYIFIAINSNKNSSGYRVWLASAMDEPQLGESTYQPDANNSSSSIVFQGEAENFVIRNIFGFSSNQNWQSWNLNSKVTMYGFTALKPSTEYYIWEVNIGAYQVVKLASYDCSLPMSVVNAAIAEKIRIYPVPASDNLFIDITDNKDLYKVELISGAGCVLFEDFYKETASINMNDYKEGIYLVKVTIGNNYYTKKINKY